MSKLCTDPAAALGGVLANGMTIAVGGFGLSGIPADLIDAVRASGVKDLTIVSNNMGVDGKGLGVLIESGQVATVLASYVGENRFFAEQFLAGAPFRWSSTRRGPWPSGCGPAGPGSRRSTPRPASGPRWQRASRTQGLNRHGFPAASQMSCSSVVRPA